MRVKSQFDCCVANKNSKTCTYTSNLKAKIAAQKLQLQNRLNVWLTNTSSNTTDSTLVPLLTTLNTKFRRANTRHVLTRRSKLSLRNSTHSGVNGNQNSKNISSVVASVPLELQLHVWDFATTGTSVLHRSATASSTRLKLDCF